MYSTYSFRFGQASRTAAEMGTRVVMATSAVWRRDAMIVSSGGVLGWEMKVCGMLKVGSAEWIPSRRTIWIDLESVISSCNCASKKLESSMNA